MSPTAPEALRWHPWNAGAFSLARAKGRPVLLSLAGQSGSYAPASVFEQSDVLRVIAERFVPVRVDVWQRPDIWSLYGSEELCVLRADGGRVCVLKADAGLAKALAEAADAYGPAAPESGEAGPVWTGAVGKISQKKLDPETPAKVLKTLKENGSADWDLLAYAAYEWKDADAQRLAIERLDKALLVLFPWDEAADSLNPAAFGTTLDLRVKSGFASWCFNIAALSGSERYRKTALALLDRAVDNHFDSAAGAFSQSNIESATVFYANTNAELAAALFRASAFNRRYREVGEKVLHFLEHKMFDPLLGVIHYQGGGTMIHGILDDNVATMFAFTEAYLATGHRPYREFADGLCRFLFQEFWEREFGGFLTRVSEKDDVPELRKPRLYEPENGQAFEAIWRLSEIKGNANYRKWIDLGLKTPYIGEAGGPFAKIQDMRARGRMDIEVVGLLSDPKTEALLDAVNRLYLPRKIVSFVDPNDQDYILAHKLEAPTYPRLFACGPDLKRVADTDDPAKVPEVVDALRA